MRIFAVAALLLLASCTPPHADRPAGIIHVPGDLRTISEAMRQAVPGDLVLVGPGTYHETVNITTERVTLRGTDRNSVIIDGEAKRGNGIVVTAPGVTVENLTVRQHLQNGVLVTGMSEGGEGVGRGGDGYHRLDPATNPPLRGFRVRYVTAARNGLYGIYAFNTQHGSIEDNHTSGSADAGIYVGQCKPCHILVRGNISEGNAVGYEGTNASGPIWVVGNRFTANRVGLTVNSDYLEALVPQNGATIAGNLVAANVSAQTPEQAEGGFGIGIGIAGGQGNTLLRNRISGHLRAGLVLASAEDMPPASNRVEGNLFETNSVDAVYAASSVAPGSGNCFIANTLRTTVPPALAQEMTCPGGTASTSGAPLPRTPPAPAGMSFLDIPLPPAQPQLPSAGTAPADPVTGPAPLDLTTINVPEPSLLDRDHR